MSRTTVAIATTEAFGAVLNNLTTKPSAGGLEGIPGINASLEFHLHLTFKRFAADQIVASGAVLLVLLLAAAFLKCGFNRAALGSDRFCHQG